MLVERITEMLSAGSSVEEVYLTLLSEGTTVAEIQDAFGTVARARSAGALQSRVVRVITVIGAALIGAGVFSFVAANWQSMADAARIAVILAGTAGFSAAGWYVRDRRGYRITGEALLVLGSVVYGAGIFLVAQMYHFAGNWPDGVIWWMAGTLLVAAAARSMALQWLGVALAIVAAFAYPIGLLGHSPSLNPYVLSSPMMIAFGALVATVSGVALRARVPERFRDRW